jgi:hypothetical protein
MLVRLSKEYSWFQFDRYSEKQISLNIAVWAIRNICTSYASKLFNTSFTSSTLGDIGPPSKPTETQHYFSAIQGEISKQNSGQ